MHRAYPSRHDGLQKGLQSPAVEVDAAADGGGGVLGLHLALEVLRLLPRGDAGIDGDRGRRCRRGCCARSTFTPESGDVVQPVLALATSGQQHGWDLSLSSPEAEGAGCDVQDVTGLFGSNPSCIMIRFHNGHLGLCFQFFSLSTTTCLDTPRKKTSISCMYKLCTYETTVVAGSRRPEKAGVSKVVNDPSLESGTLHVHRRRHLIIQPAGSIFGSIVRTTPVLCGPVSD